MSTTQSLAEDEPHIRPTTKKTSTRYLYSAATLLLLILMLIGFQQFYLHGRAFPERPLTPPIRTLIIIHGVAMSLWMVLAVVQPLLIAQRMRKLHMKLGMLGVGLAAIVTISGIKVAVESARVAPPEARLWDLPLRNFMTITVFLMVVFAAYVTVGVLNRKRPQIHRPAMFLATLFVMPAPIDRIVPIVSLYQSNILGQIFGVFFPIFFIGGVFLLIKWLLTKSWDRHFAISWAVATLLGMGLMQLAKSPFSEAFANFLFSL